jgi:hypothetical protein
VVESPCRWAGTEQNDRTGEERAVYPQRGALRIVSRAGKTICKMPIDNLGVRDGSPKGSATASRTGMVARELDAQTAWHEMDAGERGAPSRCWTLNRHSLHAALRLALLEAFDGVLAVLARSWLTTTSRQAEGFPSSKP